MHSQIENKDRYEELQDEVRRFLRAYAGDMSDDAFDALVSDVSRMRLRDELEKRGRPWTTTLEIPIPLPGESELRS